MKKLLVLLLIVSMIYGVYYGFTKIVETKEKEIKEVETKDKIQELEMIDSAYQAYCNEYINSIEKSVELNVMIGESIPSKITDPNYTTVRILPLSVDIDLNENGIVEKAIITYDNLVCNYNNGEIELKR